MNSTRRKPINPLRQNQASWVESLACGLDHAYGLHSVALRYFNAAGADPMPNRRVHDPETHLIPNSFCCLSSTRRADTEGVSQGLRHADGNLHPRLHSVNDLCDAHLRGRPLGSRRKTAIFISEWPRILGAGSHPVWRRRSLERSSYSVVERRLGRPAGLVASAEKGRQQLNGNRTIPILGKLSKRLAVASGAKVLSGSRPGSGRAGH